MRILLSCLFLSYSLQASDVFYESTVDYKLKVSKMYEGLGIPWAISFIKNHIIINDRNGFIQIIDKKTKKKKTISFKNNLLAQGQGGLLDIIKHPQFEKKPFFYFTYSKKTSKGISTALAKGDWDEKEKTIKNIKDLFVSDSFSETTRHFGSRLAFDENNNIYMSIGERGHRPNSQNLKNHAGKIIRLSITGEVLEDNPFFNQKDSMPEIWSYGHRNPQGLVYDFNNKKLWSIEHGPRGGDEINLIQKGKNYGWPIISYGKEYWAPMSVGEGFKKKGMEQPIKQYTPSIAPCGLELYSGKVFKKWKGDLFTGALKLRHINKITISKDLKTNEIRLLSSKNFRVRTIKEGPRGNIYFSTDSGHLYKIEKAK